MAQLYLNLNDEEMEALEAIAAHRHVPVSRLLEEYVSYLLVGGEPVDVSSPEFSAEELAQRAARGGSLDWLADEPELYTVTDGKPV